MKLSATNPIIIDFDPYNTSTAQAHELGARFEISESRSFHYGKNSTAAALGVGKIGLAPAPKTNHHNMAVQAAAAIGATTVSVTLGATASTAQEYAEGYLTINLTPGQGTVYKVSDQPATSSGQTQTLGLSDPINVALTTSSKANLVHNAWNAVVEAAVATRRAAGVPLVPVAQSTSTVPVYYWAQTNGVASVLADQAITLGARLGCSASVAGAVAADSTTYGTSSLTTPVGVASIMAGVDTEYRPVFLTVN